MATSTLVNCILTDPDDHRRQVTAMGPWLEAIHDRATAPILFTVDLSGSSPAQANLGPEFDAITLRLAR